MDIHNWNMDIHNWIVDIHLLLWIMCIHDLFMGIHNSVMDIPLEYIFALGFSYQYAFIASQWIQGANDIITWKQCCDFVST